MRALVYMLSIVSVGFVSSAHGKSLSASTDCGESLRERLLADPKVQSTCYAKVSVDGATVTKKYHVAIEIDRSRTTEAKMAVREICEACGTPPGPVQRQSIDYEKLADWALANATQSLARGENVSATESSDDDEEGLATPPPARPADSCTSQTNPSDRMSCRISKLNNETSVDRMRAYYLGSVQPDLQRLAASKSEADRTALRQSIMSFLTNARGVTDSDRVINASIYDYNAFLEARHFAQTAAPELRTMFKAKYETTFRERPRFNRARGLESEALDANSRFLLDLTTKEFSGTGGTNGPGTLPASNPRVQFGQPGLQQGRGFTPPNPRPGAPSGGANDLSRIFHPPQR